MRTASLAVPAPAKLNLFLHVTGRRDDGMHLLESLFVLVDLADRITLTLRQDHAIVRTSTLEGVAPEDDLAVRAARLLQEQSGAAAGVDIAVEKRIPLGAGLGGGSSDAASVLLALNRLWGVGWTRAALQALAVRLGADVPFFVGGENALARGIGDMLTAMTVPASWLALVAPPAHVATASIFAASELTRSAPRAKISVFSASYGHNDLEPVASARHPVIAATVALVERSAHGARMTGSGSGVFAPVASAHDARRIVRHVVAAVPGARGYVARILARHPLAGFAR